MAASDPIIYFDASFGGVPLLIAEIDTDIGRDIAVQSPARGDKHVLQDRGRRLTSASVEILFIDQPGLDPYTSRYEQFRNLANTEGAQIFSHPLDGSYQARISEPRVRASGAEKRISVSCTIIAEDEPETVAPIGAGSAPVASVDAVTTAQLNADSELAAVGLSTPVTAACTAAVSSWYSEDPSLLDSQTVFGGVASLTNQISYAIVELNLATDLALYPAYQAMILLAFQVTQAGAAITSTAGQLFQITVTRALPLLAICTPIYGPDDAPDYADQVANINRVRTPGLVPAGTILKMPPVPS
jgi:prophage DNA circulation protein